MKPTKTAGKSGSNTDRFNTQLLRVMRLTAIILLAGCLQVTARVNSQTITFSARNADLQSVFAVIEKQTGFTIAVKKAHLHGTEPVNIDAVDMPLQEFLSAVFKNQPLAYNIEAQTIFLSKKITSPTIVEKLEVEQPPIKGVVRDSTGVPLSGATVYNKRTKKSVQTDGKGEFTIDGEEGDVLTLTFIGFDAQNIRISGNSMLAVLRVSNSPLDEVQIQAYGTTSRRLSTGNISTVKAEQIEKQPVSNPLLALTSRVPGLEIVQSSGVPGSPVKVKIRGTNSLSDLGNEPLFVIDGMPFISETGKSASESFSDFQTISALSLVNPNDIASIEVLKDADATSIYGSRAANGVILITTKKGKAGGSRIDVNLQSGFGKVARKATFLNVDQYRQMRFEALKNLGFKAADPSFDSLTLMMGYPDLYFWKGNHDWQEEMIGGTAKYNNFQASVSGGSNAVQYMISGNYHKETTVFPGQSADQKANVLLNLNTASANQKFRTSITASYMADWHEYPKYDFTQFITLAPTTPDLLRSDGSLNWAPITDPVYNFTAYTLENNPYSTLFQPFRFHANNLLSNASLSYSIVSSLIAKISIGFNRIEGNSFSAQPSIARFPAYQGSRESYFNTNNSQSIIAEPQLTYNITAGRNRLDMLVGGSFQSRETDIQFVSASGFASDELIENMAAAAQYVNRNQSSQYKYAAMFGRLSYNFSGKYIVNINARRDGSSRFGPGKQFGNFGSVGAAWIFSDETVIKRRLPFLSFGKIRGSYGTAGNDGIGDYKYLERYNNTIYTYLETKGLVIYDIVNKDFHWESIKKAELALELGFFNDRLYLNSSYYRNRSSNQLQTLVLPRMTGAGEVTYNSPALIQNSGVELVINTQNLKGKKFSWNTSFNITRHRNKLIAYPDIETSTDAKRNHYQIGKPIGLPPVYKFLGVDPSSGTYQFADVNGNPIGGKADNSLYQLVSVNTSPEYYAGLFNAISYKNVTLDFQLQFVKQLGRNYLYSFPQSPGLFTSGGAILSNQPVEIIKAQRWKQPGDIALFGKFLDGTINSGYNEARQSDAAYSDASFMRLNNVSLSFALPDRTRQKMHLQGLRVYLQGQNLMTITRFKGLDPENQSVTSLPPLRVITAGIQVTL